MTKKIVTYALLGLFLIALASCSTSRSASRGHSGGGHCPAYGN